MSVPARQLIQQRTMDLLTRTNLGKEVLRRFLYVRGLRRSGQIIQSAQDSVGHKN
jgi:hypothetical protein